MSKNKKQGTAFETWTRKALNSIGIQARRIAEGGAHDEGDVEAQLDGDTRWVIECKARSALNIQDTLAKARRKAGGAPVILVWKRLVRVTGKQKRQPVSGEPIVVILGWDDFVKLITQAEPTAETAQPTNMTEVDNG